MASSELRSSRRRLEETHWLPIDRFAAGGRCITVGVQLPDRRQARGLLCTFLRRTVARCASSWLCCILTACNYFIEELKVLCQSSDDGSYRCHVEGDSGCFVVVVRSVGRCTLLASDTWPHRRRVHRHLLYPPSRCGPLLRLLAGSLARRLPLYSASEVEPATRRQSQPAARRSSSLSSNLPLTT